MSGAARGPRRLAVVGGGWAGAAAALEAHAAGAHVDWFEAGARFGGRARSVDIGGLWLDNGQHILIGAYTECLRCMRRAGVDARASLLRLPLELSYADGHGLRAPSWPAPLHLLLALARARGLPWRERAGWIAASLRWRLGGWQAHAGQTVAQLCHGLGPAVMQRYIEPLCVAALNTRADRADAQVFLNVLRDSLGAADRAASDYLLPRITLSELLPEPAAAMLERAGHGVHRRRRVTQLQPTEAGGWLVHGSAFDAVVMACPASEASRLLEPLAARHAAIGAALGALATLQHEPIATCYAWQQADDLGALAGRPMLALLERAGQPFQFVFDRSTIGAHPAAAAEHCLAFVASAAAQDQAGDAPAQRWQQALDLVAADLRMRTAPRLLRCIVEKRATFVCAPHTRRPAAALAPGLALAGDFVEGPYPSTLEGAVRSGTQAARLALLDARSMLAPATLDNPRP